MKFSFALAIIITALHNNNATGQGLYGIGQLQFGLFGGCVQHAARSLWAVGIPTIPIINMLGPKMLYYQLLIRQVGIDASPFLNANNY